MSFLHMLGDEGLRALAPDVGLSVTVDEALLVSLKSRFLLLAVAAGSQAAVGHWQALSEQQRGQVQRDATELAQRAAALRRGFANEDKPTAAEVAAWMQQHPEDALRYEFHLAVVGRLLAAAAAPRLVTTGGETEAGTPQVSLSSGEGWALNARPAGRQHRYRVWLRRRALRTWRRQLLRRRRRRRRNRHR